MAMAPTAPTSMNGLRTRSLSEKTPNTIRATASAPQNQTLRPLAWVTENCEPSGFWKVVE